MEKDISIDHALRATWQALAKLYNEQAAKHDSTMAMALSLLYIDAENGTPSTSLGPSMGMEATSLSRTLNAMEDKGFIFREKNPQDGRGVLIKLTELGLEKREISKDSVHQFNQTVRGNIEAKKIDHFFEVTALIKSLIENRSIFKD